MKFRIQILLMGLILAVCVSGGAYASALDDAREARLDGNNARAADILQKAAAADPGQADVYLYLLADTYARQKQYENAVKILDKIIDGKSQSEWRHKALFKKADCLMALGRFAEADAIYGDQAGRILSRERKVELANIYISYADSYFKPEDEGKEPDYAKALVYYQKSLEMEVPEDALQQVKLRIALCYYKQGNHSQASAGFRALDNDETDPPIRSQAMYHLGRSLLAARDTMKARKAFQNFLDKYPENENAADAAFRIAGTYNIPKPGDLMQLELGVAAHRDFMQKYPNDENAPRAAFEIAQAYFNMKRYEEAVAALEDLNRMFGHRVDLDEVPRAGILLGQCYFDQKRYPEAIRAWQAYLDAFPTHAEWQGTSKRIIATEYAMANDALTEKHYADARRAFEKFLATYPLHDLAVDAMFELGDIEYLQENYKPAVALWEKLVSKYPNSSQASHALFLIGEIQEQKFLDLDAALKTYKSVSGNYGSQAQQRAAAMQKKELLVVTERTFSSKEPAKLKITARNIPELKFRAYRIDMETYFKKYHDFRGVENLDIALIDPDVTWTYKIADYSKMRSYDLPVSAPDLKPGAYAVTVGDEELEATTLLLVTDVAAVIKSSRNAVFVLALDTRTGQPAKGARVLISNGTDVFEGGRTGADGVFQYRGDKVSAADTVAVLVLQDGGMASNRLSVGGIQYVASGRDLGVIYTERPAYRPGQTVKAKGILRDNKDGVYTFKPGVSYTVSVLSPGGIVLTSRAIALSEFGTFSLEYDLSPDAAPGTYGIQAVGPGEGATVFSSDFTVQEYKLERVKLSIEMDDAIFFRGETAKGKIKAQYYFGEPVANKKVEYRIQSRNEVLTGETDAKGEIAFSFETGDYDENVAETITATIPDEHVSAAEMVWIAATGFTLNVKTLRDVYLAGESVEITAKAVDLAGKPAEAKDIRLEVLQRVTQNGTTSEVRVREMPMTSKDTGAYRATVTLKDGGTYVMRAFARDKFNNPVVAESYVFLSGDDDTNRVRVITEREEFRVGEAPVVTVVFREDPATALLTYEGEAIYKYETVRLKKGENQIKLDITDDLAPNFTLGVAVMSGNRFHQADKTFDVIKGLVITLEPDRAAYAPGESMKLKVKTTDQDGRPVRAELSLALVDEALYSLYADNVPKLNDFFFGARRAARFITTSSNTFAYTGVTREVPKEVIAEGRMTSSRDRARPDMEMEEDADEFAAGLIGDGYGGYADDKVMAKQEKKKGMARPSVARSENAPAEAYMVSPATTGSGLPAAPGGAPVARLREFFPETGYWNPHVDTGANGSTSLDVVLPDTATTWRLTSRGATVKTLVGEATIPVITKQDFFIQAKNPVALVEGSDAGFIIDVHNLTATARDTTVTATLSVDGAAGNNDSQTVSVEPGGTGVVHFAFKVGAGRAAVLTVEARAGDRADKIKLTIPVTPYGAEIAAARSGSASEDTTVTAELPGDTETTYPEMKILISPGADRSVMDIEFTGPMSNNSTALEAIATAYKLDYLNKTGGGAADRAVLASRLKGLVMRLVTNRNQGSGTWNWTRSEVYDPVPDLTVTGNALWALALARKQGIAFPEDALDGAVSALQSAFAKAATDEDKAEILHALSLVDQADYAYVNRLDRVRSTLSVRALSFVALSYMNMGRPELAADLAAAIASGAEKLPDTRDPFLVESDIFWRDVNADVGLAMLALVRAQPSSPAVRVLKKRVESLRWGGDWGTPEATMTAASALAVYYGAAKPAANRYELKISVNGKPVKTVSANSSDPAITVAVPRDLVQRGRNTVAFNLDGRGEFAYSVVMSGFRKSVPAGDQFTNVPYIASKKYFRSAPRFQGKEFPAGDSILSRGSARDANVTNQVLPGDYVTARLDLSWDKSPRGLFVVQDSIPAGATIDKESISGRFENYEIGDGRITFYCSRTCDDITYKLYGYLPGAYALPPASVSYAGNPWNKNYATQQSFTVLPVGAPYDSAYELTPDQLFNMGKAYFDAEMYGEAGTLLTKLLNDYKDIDENPYKETHRMLMYACIQQDDSKCIVSHFEQLKERYPELSLNFEDMLRVGKAYHDIKESERAIEVYRTVLESSFMTDGDVRVFLEDQGKFLDSIAFLDSLVRDYPDLNVVENAAYSTGHILFEKSAAVDTVPEFQEKKLTKSDIAALAVKAFRRYMLLYPDSPYMDEASFSLASVYFDVMMNDKVIDLTRTFRKRYAASTFLDSFEYLQAYAHFESGDFSSALDLCHRVAEGKYTTAAGGDGPSDNRNIAIYLTGQIYHAMNKPDKAAENYEKVAQNFTDAAGALDYFNRKTFKIPELTVAPSGKSASLTLTHRNIAEAEIKIYRVDLLKFYLMRKNLEGMAGIQLSGVKPIFEKKLTLSKGREYRDRETAIQIPLGQDGAYLVEMRAGSRYLSGMILRSNLEVEVQEDDLSGRVRVNVLDARSGRYVSQADVRVVGSEDGRIQSGLTDLRGIFTAEGVAGRATAIVKKDDQYAFFSGEQWLQAGAPAAQPAEQVDFNKMRGKNTQFIYDMNRDIQMRNDEYINDNFQRQEGIQIQQIEQNAIMQK